VKIMLNAGHGKETSGKRSPDGMREYEFNSAVTRHMKLLLANYVGVETYFSHSDSRDIPLKERTDMANGLGVDLWVGVHANAFGSTWNDANGIETFVYLGEKGIALSVAKLVQKSMISKTLRKDRGVKHADLHEVRETKMPAILVECGFMTNKQEAALLKVDSYRRLCAVAIVDGIVEYYNLKLKAPLSPPKKAIYKVQVGAFVEKDNALDLVNQLAKLGFKAIITD
jgi:N-acetylmuramoyl-L-alanine amidase